LEVADGSLWVDGGESGEVMISDWLYGRLEVRFDMLDWIVLMKLDIAVRGFRWTVRLTGSYLLSYQPYASSLPPEHYGPTFDVASVKL
jgi:hypothetical protein